MQTIFLDGPIGQGPGELSARWLRSQLPADGSDVTLQIHSEGGAVLEGFAMLDVLKAYPGNVKAVVSSMALSAASLLLTACDETEVTPNAYVMLHNPHMEDNADLSDTQRALIASLTDRMVAIYSERSRKSAGEIRRMMTDETFMNADDAVRRGFADRVVDARTIAARVRTRTIVARAGQSVKSQWMTAVAASGGVAAAARLHPELRLRLISEANKR